MELELEIQRDLLSIEDLSGEELKLLCKKYKLKVSGKKSVLIERLLEKAREVSWCWYEGLEERRVSELKEKMNVCALVGKGKKAELQQILKDHLKMELKSAFTVDELKNRLRAKKLRLGGNKDVLATRLMESMCAVDLELRAFNESGGLADKLPGKLPNKVPCVSVCTFNVLNLNSTSRHKNYPRIIEMLSQFGVVALQEVLTEDVMLFLKKGLPDFDYIITPRKIGRTRKEYCAFLFNTKKVRCIQSGLFADDDDLFERQPFVATFECCDRRKGAKQFDFTLMSLHVLFGKSEKDRRPELGHLAQAARKVLEANGAEQDLIVLGDFNFDPNDVGWEEMKGLGFRALFHPPQKTTVGDISLYDNIWLLAPTRKVFLRRGVIEFDKQFYANDTLKARAEVSDHRPCYAVFRTDVDLDADEYGSLDSLSVQLNATTLAE